MDKIVKVTGYCPVQNKNQTIQVEFIDATTNSGIGYAKGRPLCSYSGNNEKCECCKCPIYQDAKWSDYIK